MIPAAVVEAFMSQSSNHLNDRHQPFEKPTVVKAMWATWLRIGWVALLTGLLIAVWSVHYTLALNATPSLPHTLYVVKKGVWPTQVGDLVAYRSKGHGPLPAGITLVKRVVGMPGDEVLKMTDVLNGAFDHVVMAEVGHGKQQVTIQRVKPLSRDFKPLQGGPVGIIPDMHFHVSGEHVDSFDSRYALMGWVRADQVIGKAVWAW